MDAELRARLEQKRRLAQLRRARAAASTKFRAAAPALCASGVRFAKLVPERCREALGDLTNRPGEDERLLWSAIPGGTCARWDTPDERDALLRRALAACAAARSRVAVIWHPWEAGLRLRAGDLAACAGPVLDQGRGETTWIVAAEGGRWLIEAAWWDREICWEPERGGPSTRS